uniref:Small cell adhesion glycoprotein n=1 Tax=Dromaius novaehollandiae TaxID=8790 RepID=A0A8C4PEY7_DRONO
MEGAQPPRAAGTEAAGAGAGEARPAPARLTLSSLPPRCRRQSRPPRCCARRTPRRCPRRPTPSSSPVGLASRWHLASPGTGTGTGRAGLTPRLSPPAVVIALVFVTLLTVLVVIVVYLYKNKGSYLTYERPAAEGDVSVQMEDASPGEKAEYFI